MFEEMTRERMLEIADELDTAKESAQEFILGLKQYMAQQMAADDMVGTLDAYTRFENVARHSQYWIATLSTLARDIVEQWDIDSPPEEPNETDAQGSD